MDIYSSLKIDKTSPVPIYQQLTKSLEEYCLHSESGSPIPTERDLSAKLSVSRTILRKALDQCVQNGVLIKTWGKGIFVADKKRKKRVLVVMSSLHDEADPGGYILPGVEKRANELEIELERLPTIFLWNKSEDFVTDLLQREKFDGVLFLSYSPGFEEQVISALQKCQIPIYWPHMGLEYARRSHFHCGYVDSRKAFRDALLALVEHKRKNILSLSLEETSNEGIRGYSKEEYLELQRSLGLPGDESMLLFTKYHPQSIYLTLETFLSKGRAFDGLLCFSDFVAIHAIDYLKCCKIRIPEEVSVMGYCGYPGGQFMDPPLSTIDYHYFQLGYEALDTLFSLPPLTPENVCRIVTKHTTIIRGSLCPAEKGERLCK